MSIERIVSLSDSKRKPLVLFSGGYDSTMCLLYLLPYTDVDTISVSGLCSYGKEQREREAREYVFNQIKNQPNIVRNVFHQTIDPLSGWNTNAKLSQVLPWLYAAARAISPAKHSCLVVGYLGDDDSVPVHNSIKKAWKHLIRAMFPGVMPIPLIMPIAHLSKLDIVKNTRQVAPRFEEHLWFCQTPDHVVRGGRKEKDYYACGKCSSCLKMRQAEMMINPPVELNYIGHIKPDAPTETTETLSPPEQGIERAPELIEEVQEI